MHVAKHNVDYGKCKHCGESLKTKSIFCSNSCSTTYNNLRRDSSIRPGPKPFIGPPRHPRKKQVVKLKENTCIVCSALFIGKGHRKTCSVKCRGELLSKNRGRYKRSFLETSFSTWLDQHKINHKIEVSFYNTELSKNYCVDFLFPQFNLIIELDGTQHKLTVEKDKIRDEYITRVFGYNIIRITHKEYVSKSRLLEIQKVLQVI